MPFYYTVRKTAEGRRTASRLLELQSLLENGTGEPGKRGYVAPVPARTLSETLLLATWNIREFDSSKYGSRMRESMFYIAEIISHFDLVAIQEVREDVSALDELRSILGRRSWRYVVTDVTAGTGGNKERMAFLYDQRKVTHTGLASEIVLPPKKGKPVTQFARTPYLVGFQAGWFKFCLCSVHIFYGGDEPNQPQRVAEIDALAKFLGDRTRRYREAYRKGGKSHSEYENIALLGDFNIFSIEDDTFKALEKNGFKVPEGLHGDITNVGKKGRAFDQIAFLEDEKNVESTGHAGSIDFFSTVFRRPEDQTLYAPTMSKTIKDSNAKKSASDQSTLYEDRTPSQQNRYYGAWRTFQMSDHLPLWVELKIDFSAEYLERKAKA